MKIAVIGAGSWGTALASMLGDKHEQVMLWARGPELCREMTETRRNGKYLPDAELGKTVQITSDLGEAVASAEIVLLVTPSHGIREIAKQISGLIRRDAVVVTAAKGLEIGSLKRMSEIVAEEIPFVADTVVALSGPNHAEEVGQRQPSATVVASISRDAAEKVQDALITEHCRVYTNPDIIGVELGGALKNIVALGAGIAEGLGLGDNAKAALMTRGLAEIARLGCEMGANPVTFAGLSGVGDLFVTCMSRHSRNRRAGLLLAQGKTVEEVVAATNMVVEGIRSTMAAYELARRHNVEMPITQQMYKVLYEGMSPRDAGAGLMSRGPTHEVEEMAVIDKW